MENLETQIPADNKKIEKAIGLKLVGHDEDRLRERWRNKSSWHLRRMAKIIWQRSTPYSKSILANPEIEQELESSIKKLVDEFATKDFPENDLEIFFSRFETEILNNPNLATQPPKTETLN